MKAREPNRPARDTRGLEARGTPVEAIVAATGLVSATIWYGLIETHLVVDAPPELPATADRAEKLDLVIGYVASTSGQYIGDLVVVSVAFAALFELVGRAATALAIPGPFGLVRLGCGLFVGAQLFQAGSYRGLGDLVGTGADNEALYVSLRVADAVDDAIEIGAFTALGLGTLALSRRLRLADGRRVSPALTRLLGLAYIVLAVSLAMQRWTLVDLVMVLGAGLLAPWWVLRLGQLLTRPREGTTGTSVPRTPGPEDQR